MAVNFYMKVPSSGLIDGSYGNISLTSEFSQAVRDGAKKAVFEFEGKSLAVEDIDISDYGRNT